MGASKNIGNKVKLGSGSFKTYRDAIVSNIRLAILDDKCTITWVNDKFCKLTQYKKDELIGRPITEINLVSMHSHEFRAVHAHISTGQAWSGEIKSRTKHGAHIWLKTNILPILHKDGHVGSYLILSSNITETKTALEEKQEVMETLTRSEARYKALVNHQPDLMSLCDRHGVRTFVNEKFCELMGKSQSELIGTNIKDLPLRGLSPDVIDRVFQVTRDTNVGTGVFELENAKGEKVWMSLCVQGIFDKEGKLFEILTTGRDVTTLKNAEIGLSKYVEDLERIAFMTSHRVRAPIATMLGLLELLRLNAIHSDQWSDVFMSFEKCMQDLDVYTHELGAFINQQQSGRKPDL